MKSVGIKAIDGGFTVYNNSQFSNLWYGIDARRWNTNTPFYVYYSTFTDNQVGILANTINNIVVQRCTLEIGGNANVAVTNQIGLSLQTCSGYSIEENIFRLSSGNIIPGSKQGTNINNSLAADNQIYKNKYIGLTNGNVAIGVNRDNSFPTLHGLQYLCNWHESVTAYDIFIAKQVVGLTAFGIRATQGTGSAPAGNTFSHLGPMGAPTDIFTKASGFIYYYWTGDPLQEPLYFNAPDITIASVTNPPNTCPSHICDPPCALAQEITMFTGEYDTAETAYLDLLYTYNSLMDGGNTNALLTQIQQTWSNEAVQLYNDLISQSPYLSEEVLIETANRNILPPTLLLAVCIANPDATRSDALLHHLQYEIANPLTQYMIDMIVASWDLHTSRTIMESTLAHYSYQMANASDHILASLHFSSEENDPTNNHAQIIYWLTRVQTLTAKYELIEIYLAEHNYTSAQIILDSIPFWFRLSEDQSAAYNDYVYFYNFRKTLYQNQSDLSQLDTTQIQELANFALPIDNFAKALAQNALCHFYNICIEEDYELDYSGERIMYNNSTAGNMHTADQDNNSINVAPNPATNTATFKYHLAPGNENAKLNILDITGKTIANFTLSEFQGEIIWDIGNANNGSYFYQVKNGNETLAKGQIAVKK